MNFRTSGRIGFVNSLLIINPPWTGCHYRAGIFYLMRLSTGCQCKEINFGMMWSLFSIRVMIHAARCLAVSVGYLALDKYTDSSVLFSIQGKVQYRVFWQCIKFYLCLMCADLERLSLSNYFLPASYRRLGSKIISRCRIYTDWKAHTAHRHKHQINK